MRETRVRVSELVPGELILRTPKAEVNGRFIRLSPMNNGHRVVGPRGGKYELTALGGRSLVGLRTTAARTPIVSRDSFVTVLRDSE